MATTPRPAHRRLPQRGVALIEFALILPMLLVLTFITTEFGRAVYEYSVVTQSVRDAARYLSMVTPNSHQAQAANIAVYGNAAGTGRPLARGLSTGLVQSEWLPPTGSSPAIRIVRVRVAGYQFQPLFTTAFGQDFGVLEFPAISASMRSYL